MFCAISGVAPEHPVVSKLSGHVFEQSVVEKYIESTGKCPVTGEPLEAGDLLPLKSSSAVKPRPVAAASIPGMLTLFQNEWDALMLETYTLKQQLETVRQELGHALYQHDAACRVIARLVKERDDARAALAEARAGALPPAPAQPAAAAPPTASAAAGGGGAMDVEAVPPAAGLSAELSAKFDATAKGLSKGRKKRQMAAGYADAQAIAGYALLGASTPAAHAGGVVCLDAHATERVLASGGADGRLVLATCDGSYASVQQVEAHAARVTSVCLHPSRPLVLSSAADGSARVSSTAGGAAVDLARVHKASVNSCTLHASGEYCVTASDDRSWALFDLESGSCVLRHQSDAASAGCALRIACHRCCCAHQARAHARGHALVVAPATQAQSARASTRARKPRAPAARMRACALQRLPPPASRPLMAPRPRPAGTHARPSIPMASFSVPPWAPPSLCGT